MDWGTIFDGLAAVGTITAAIIAALALRSAASTGALAEKQLAAQTRPLLIAVPSAGYLEQSEELIFPNGHTQSSPVDAAVLVAAQDEQCFFTFPLRNVGAGLARITDTFLRLTPEEARGEDIPPNSGTRPRSTWTFDDVAPGERTRLLSAFDAREDAWVPFRQRVERRESFRVDVTYEDVAGGQREVALVTISPKPRETSWYVERVDHTPAD